MASPAKNTTSVSASSSPSIHCRPNPKPRNSETGDPMRRSFRGSPFPADPSRRNSIGRVEFGDKENQNDKDPMAKAPKGSKHFMSPTISAVSKINPSPRKKILSDRNEVSRSFEKTTHQIQVPSSSVSFSDVISIMGEEVKDEGEVDEKTQLDEKEDSHDITVTDFDETSNGDSFDDSSFKISPLPYTFPEFGSQEVDPLVAPYDPKKNYLSPRPQFLHYKPNPRIEHPSDECKQLDELFSSEISSSDTDLSAEESQQEDEDASQEGVVAAVEEDAEVIHDEEDEDCLEAAESEEEVVGESIEEEETHQITRQSRFKASKLLGSMLVLGVAYFLLVTFTQPNVIQQDSPFYKFRIPPEVIMSARESFEQLSVKLVMWAESSLVYMDKLISSLGEEEEGYGSFQYHNLTDLLEDTRLSDSVFQTTSGEISVAGLLADSQNWSLEMDAEEENGGGPQEPEEPVNGGETDLEAVYEEDGNEFEQESEGVGVQVNSEMVCEFDNQTEIKMAKVTEVNGGDSYPESLSEEGNGGQEETNDVEEQKEYEENDQKNMEESHESETRPVQNDEKNMEEAEFDTHQVDDVESSAISGHQQEETEVANAETVPEEEGIGQVSDKSVDISAETSDGLDGNDLEEESGLGEVVDAAGAEEVLLSSDQKKVIVLFSTVMVLLAVAAAGFFFLANKKKTKPVMLLREDERKPATISDTKEVNSEHVPVEKLIKERLSSLNFQQEEEVDDNRKTEVSSSFRSGMSYSFHKNKSLHSCNNKDDLNEYQSGGGGRKSNDSGESMASSASEYSIGSVSYGSFTTYEKIQKKSGRKEKEEVMVTPVRRSSRIRNHQQHSGQ